MSDYLQQPAIVGPGLFTVTMMTLVAAGLLAIMGATSPGFITLPLGIIGDIIDDDTLIHRQPRGGVYRGVWSFARKLAPAAGIGITPPLLAVAWLPLRRPRRPGIARCAEVRLLFGPVPFYVLGGVLLYWFPITARRHDIIRRRLHQRQQRAG